MKFCSRPFDHLYIDFNGNMRFCGWTSGEAFGRVQDGIDKVWHSERADKIRDAILQGDFSYCRADVCPFMMNNTLPDSPGKAKAELLKPLPEKIQCAYDYQCNLSCPSCRKTPIVGSERADIFFAQMKEQLAPLLNKAKFLDFGGHGDPFYSKHTMDMMANLKPEREDFALSLQTNGLYFTRENWQKIEHLGKYHITVSISIDSLNPVVYSKLRRGGKLELLLKNLEMIGELRKAGLINDLHAVMVVQDLNFMEIPQFIDYCFSHNFDHVQLENLYNWGTFNDKEYFSKNLLNPEHPNHKFFKKILNKALENPRVRCWAGHTERIANKWVVTGQSDVAVCNITEHDVIDINASIDQLSHAIWNRDYIFVTELGKYRGTIFYEKFHDMMGKIVPDTCTLCDFFDVSLIPLQADDLAKIFTPNESFHNNRVIPIVKTGEIIAKAIPCA